jgi:uncharacterized protein YuzE
MLKYDPTADAFYRRMDRSVLVVESDEIDPGLIVDFGPNGNVVAIELLDAAARLGTPAARPPVRYDRDADVLYIRIDDRLPTTDSDLTDDDIIIRYNGDAIVGCAILHASKRLVPAPR